MSTPKEYTARYRMALQAIIELSYDTTTDKLRDIASLALKEGNTDGDNMERRSGQRR